MRNKTELANKNFDSSKINEFKDIWVFCELEGGKVTAPSCELLSEGRKLADKMSCGLNALVLGSEVEEQAKLLGGYGADRVILCDHPLLKDYSTDAYTKVVCDAISEMKPEVFLLPATCLGRDLAPRCAARLHTGLSADCTGLDSDGDLLMTLPAFGGNLMATIVCQKNRPAMATVRPGAFKKQYDPSREQGLTVEKYRFDLEDDVIRAKIEEVVAETSKTVDLSEAECIVAVGRGISADPERGMKLAEELAEVLGGTVAGSRVAVDNGWITHDRLVGQTGKIVRPKLYIALGISGAIQHRVGMENADHIIAVNKNSKALIFGIADYGICGDLFKVTPMLIDAFRAAKKEK